MQVRTLLRTVGQVEPLNVVIWGEALVHLLNQHLPEPHQLSPTCTVLDVRKSFKHLDTATRNAILNATVDLEVMTIDLGEPGNTNGKKLLLATGMMMIGIIAWLTKLLNIDASNPDTGMVVKLISEIGPYLLDLL